MKRFTVSLLTAAAAAALVVAAPAPSETPETDKDRDAYLPNNKYAALPGKAVGVLASDVVPVMGREGRSGTPDNCGFSVGNASYRWVYVPVTDNPILTKFTVKAGEKGDKT